MASREAAIKNNLNDRARKVGQFDELTTQDIDALIAFYDYSCLQCGEKPASSVDHVRPLSKGGTNTRDNLQLLCTNHNKAKGDEEIDYRNGKVCPADFVAPTAQEKPYKKHDWDLIEFEFVSGDSTLRDLAQKHQVSLSHIGLVSSRENWLKKRENIRNKIGTDALDAAIEEEIDLRLEISRTTLDFLKLWRRQANRIGNQDLIKILELGAKASNVIVDNRTVTIKDWRDVPDVAENVDDIQRYATEAAADYFEGDTGSDYSPGA
jgi:hypothetical protein